MKLSNLEMTEKSIDVQENDKDVHENDMLLAEVRRQVNPLSLCACTHFVQRIHITPHRTSAEERVVFRSQQIPFDIRNFVCREYSCVRRYSAGFRRIIVKYSFSWLFVKLKAGFLILVLTISRYKFQRSLMFLFF